MLRVLYVNSSAELLGGAERCLLELVAGLRGQVAAVVALPRPGPLAAALRAEGATVRVRGFGVPRSRRELATPLAAARLAGIVPGALRLAQVIARERIDLVHTNTSVPVAGALAARLMRRPHIWHVREVLDRPPVLAPGLRAIIPRLADRVILISAAVRAPFGSPAPALERRLLILPDGIDVTPFVDLPLTRPGGVPLIGMVARISPWKGHAAFLTMAATVAAAVPHARFVVAGGCPPEYADLRRALVAQAGAPPLAGRVTWLGAVDRPGIRDLFGRLTILVHAPATAEPLGLVVLEAMAAGVPVVALAQGGPLEILRDGVDGRLVPPGDPDALAAAVAALLADPATRLRLAQAARAKVCAEYAQPAYLSRIAALYDSLTLPGGSSRK